MFGFFMREVLGGALAHPPLVERRQGPREPRTGLCGPGPLAPHRETMYLVGPCVVMWCASGC